MKQLFIGLLLVLSLAACKAPSNQASPSKLPDGFTLIGPNMYGIWHASGGKKCSWKKLDKSGKLTGKSTKTVTRNGEALSQAVLFGTADNNGTFRSQYCGLWSK